MKDTEVYLRNQLARILHSIKKIDQSHIPISERRFIRLYALLWLLGRSIAIGYLVFVSIPLTWNYLLKAYSILGAGYEANPYAFIDMLLVLILVLLPQAIGFWLWIRSFRLNLN